MKNSFKFSIAINVLLAGLVFWLLRRESTPVVAPNITAIVNTETGKVAAPLSSTEHISPSASAGISTALSSFRWSQLESSDYKIYVTNLRGIGCPEQTIRDIITADVDEAIYAPQRDQLKQKDSGPALDDLLQTLAGQESAMIANLLGGQPNSPPPAVESASAVDFSFKTEAERDLERPVSTPLVLQQVNPAEMNLSQEQLQTIEALRQNFLEDIGGTNQDPNDPAYFQRWQAAQRKADTMLASFAGRKFVLDYQATIDNSATQAP